MPKNRSWTDEDLKLAVAKVRSYRRVIIELRLIPAGGNYTQVQRRISELRLDTAHFRGKGWLADSHVRTHSPKPLDELLVKNGTAQSYKLKQKLFERGDKQQRCELCGWAQKAEDGRIPVELDHINGDHSDNRLENLRILCPNCHSLQPTHRGKNKKVHLARVV